jgi:sulfate transport system permease protein
MEAFAKGILEYWKANSQDHTLSAFLLTIKVALIAVPLNTIIGILAAFLLSRFVFPGKNILLTLIESPFAVSPVIAGLIFVLIFGREGWMRPLLQFLDWEIIFNTPGLVIATIFITFPFVTKELLPLMQSQGNEEEEAAILLNASFFKVFTKIIIPNIKWGLLYGIVLCNARAMGEFGAVSVISGHIRGKTNTLPLEVEILYNEYNSVGAFATASLLVLLSILTLIIKNILERKIQLTSLESNPGSEDAGK